ncbi:DUF4347 domain-containing protein [Bradyrhizobium sp. Ash2021]|uniref:DUF4347 domain-containing protein n=1 Tax=Bradyrhizobium sp. Ash2021 TaxID=2954771 RepID=UPI002815821C|nr:DUF4347 domain-containing protein [Bradyrhizobium sp. Ash2021]WMT72033.1 DUF4347 domain-containing protein [Bradyrhizobium sp. Ash2021]
MTAPPKREIAFIDRGVDDLETLLKGFRPDVEPILLSNDEPAPRQMARAVQGREGIEAIHVIAHGRPGEVAFGAGVLSAEKLHEHAADLNSIGRAIGKDGDLRLWSCETGQGERGSRFVSALARVTGKAIAAATGLVGSYSRGGCWELEARSGALGVCPPLTVEGRASYAGVMNTFTFNLNEPSNTFTYTIGTAQVIAPSATFTDQGNKTYDGSTLVVSLPAGDTTDALGISSTTGDGITVSGANILYNGIIFATFTGGTGGTPLTITYTAGLSGNSTPSAETATQALIQAITFDAPASSPATEGGTYAINFVFTQQGGNGAASAATTTFHEIEPPIVTVPASVSVNEDATVALTITETAQDGDDALGNVTITGVPSGVTFNHGNLVGSTLTLTQAQLSGLTMTIPDSDQGNFVLSVTGSTTGSEAGTSAPQTINVTVNPVADAPTLTVPASVTVTEGGAAVALNITDVLSEADADSSLGNIVITGVPSGVTFNHGNLVGSTLTLTPAQLSGLTMTVPEGDNFTLGVSATTSDGGNVATSTGSIAVTVNGVAEAPTLTVPASVTVTEGGAAVALNITDVLSEADADSSLGNIIITGVPSGVTFNHGSAGAGNTWTLNPATDLSGLTITVPEGDSFTLGVSATTSDGGNVATSTGSISVTVNGVAEAPTLTVPASVTVTEGGAAVALNITDVLSEADADSSLGNIIITGVPSGVSFNHGTLVGGTLTLTQAQLSGLTMTVPEGDNFTLGVSATTSDGGNVATSTGSISVTVNGVADAPTLTVPASVTVTEGGAAVALNITDVLSEADADSSLGNIIITGVPSGVTFNHGSAGAGNTWTLNPATDLSGLTITVPEGDSFTLGVSATTSDGGNVATSTGSISVTVNGVAEAPTLTVPASVTVTEGGAAVALNITDVLSEADADSSLGNIIITGVPSGVSFNHGTLVGGTLTLTQAQLSGLTMTVPEGDNFTLGVSATTSDGGNVATSTGSISVTVNGVADAPTLTVPASVTVTEGGAAVALNITDVLSEADADSSLGNIIITGVPSGVTFNHGSAGAGNTWTLNPATDLSGLTITVPEGDSFTLGVSATTSDGGNVATSTGSISVTVNGVAEAPTLTVPASVTVTEGGAAVALNITDVLSEADADSSLGNIIITGVPSGVSFNHGTLVGGTLTLTQAQLSGLTMTVPEGDNFTLGVSATTSDGGNVATSTGSISVTVNGVADAPTLTVPASVTVTEGGAAVALNITDVLSEADADSSLGNIIITGVPSGVTFNHGSAGAGNTWTLNPATDLSGLTITVPEGDSFTLGVSATTSDGGNVATSTGSISVTVNGVAEAPTLTVPASVTVTEGGAAVALNITDVLSEADADSSLGNIIITGVPSGVTFNHGSAGAGNTWTLNPATDLSGLTITVPEGDSFTLGVSATTSDGGNVATSTGSISVTVNGVAEAPTLTVPASVTVTEGGAAVALNITDVLSEADADSSLGNIIITGVPSGVTFNHGSAGAGNTWTLNPATDLSGLTITVPEGDSFTLGVSATTNDGGNIATSTGTITVDVTPVAEAPVLANTDVSFAAASVNEDSNVGINLTPHFELDADATDSVTISGLGTATISDGNGNTYSGASVTITAANVASGLTLHAADDDTASITLTVQAHAAEGATTADSAIQTITVDVTPVAEAPVLANTDVSFAAASVNEDSNVGINLTPHFELDADATDSVTISGLGTATISDGNGNTYSGASVTITAANVASGLTLHAADDDTASITLTVQAHAAEGATTADSAIQTITVDVTPVAEAPVLANTDVSFAAASVNEDSNVGINLTPHFELDADATDSVTISGLGTATISDGNGNTYSGASVTITAANVASGLTLHAADDDTASITLTVQAHAAEGATTADSAIQTITVDVTPVAEAPVLANTDVSFAAASVNEDSNVGINLTPHFELDADATDSVTISGLGTATISDGNGNTYSGASVTITAANVASGLTLHAADDDTASITLTVQAHAAEGATTADSAIQTITVDVTPVAEAPVLANTDVSFAAASVNEDSNVGINLTPHFELDADATDSVTISGLGTATISDGNGNTYSGASVTITAANVASGLTLHAADDDTASITLTVQAHAAEGATTADSAIQTITVDVTPVAEAPVLANTDVSFAAASVNEDSNVGINLTPHFELDADATDSVTISGLGTATISDGNGNTYSGASVTITAANVASGLTLHAADDDTASITLTVQAHAAEGATTADSAIQTITVTEVAVPEAPTLTASAAASSVNEGGTVGLTITPTFESDPDATNTVTITGVPTTASLSNTGGTLTPVGGVYTLTAAQLAGLTLHAGDDDVSTITLQVTANATEGSTTAHSATQTITITENPVPEAPTLTASAAASSVNEDGTFGLTITPTFESDPDATDTVTITGLVVGESLTNSLNHTFTGSSITLTQAELAGLLLHAGDDDVSTITLQVTANATEGSTTAHSTTQTITITEVAVPEAPTLTASAAASSVNEGGTVGLTITPTFESDPDATNTVTITGVPTTASLSNTGGTLTPVGGVYTLTAAQLVGLTLHAGDDDVSTITLHVTANATEGSTTAHSATQTITITENPVPEAPTLDLNNSLSGDQHTSSVSGNQNTAIPIYIQSALSEVDPDSTLLINISGLPAGVTLNQGHLNTDGSYTLTTSQLAGLTLTETGTTQHFTLTVDAQVTEGSSHADTTGTIDVTVNTSPVSASGERFVISEGSTWDDTFTKDLLANDSSPSGGIHLGANALFNSSGQAASTASVHYADGTLASGYTVTEDASGILHLTVDKNVVSGGNVQAPDVFFNYTVTDSLGHTAVATADIKAINVTPGNNALDLTGPLVNPYNFSYIDGTKGSDTFKGGAGNDTFVGGAGADSFSGGTGNDTFKYTAITDSQPGSGKFDTISDFTHGSDKIDFSAISGLNSTVQSVAVNNLTSTPASIAAHTIDIVVIGGNTIVYANASAASETIGNNHEDMQINLTGVTSMTSSDFILHH